MARIAVVSRKPALRGRFRREVRTLLEEGHELFVLGVRTETDFLQGFQHPNLTVTLITPRSFLTRLGALLRRIRRARRAGVSVDRVSGEGVNEAWREKRGALGTIVQWVRPLHRISVFADHWKVTERDVLEWKPDIVHTCDLDGLVGGAKAARSLGVPFVHDCHELYLERVPFTWLERELLGRVEKRFMRHARFITVSSASIGEEYERRYGVDSIVYRNCAYLPERVEKRDLRALVGIDPSTKVVLYQGGFNVERGLEEMVRSVRGYPGTAVLVLLGYGPLKSKLEEITEGAGVGDRVFFLDAVPPDELLGYTASADLGVIPYKPTTLNNKLALGNKIFEYLAAGIPVVAADNPELRRVVEDSGCGFLFDPFDPDSLAQAVIRLLSTMDEVDYATKAKRYASENSWEKEKQILLEAYASITPGLPVARA